jgi:WD repeat-containing protein 59
MPIRKSSLPREARDRTFRNPPRGNDLPPPLSAPVGNRGILAEVRAVLPSRPHNPVLQPHRGSAARAALQERESSRGSREREHRNAAGVPSSVQAQPRAGRGISRWKGAPMDTFAWLSSVKIGEQRESRSATASGGSSRAASRSRESSLSGQPPNQENLQESPPFRRMSGSDVPITDERREEEGNQSLQEE